MNLPQAFINSIKSQLGNESDEFLKALAAEAPTSVRVNSKMPATHTDAVGWCATGFYLPERPSFTADPLFHAGTYYVQEASSMFIEQAMKRYVNEPVNILDLCAAPGGKSTHLSSLLPGGSLLVSNEIVRSRAYILSENMQKWGNANVVVTNNTPEDFGNLDSFFNAMLIDAPCSGEGMFRKDEASINEWSIDNVKKCVGRQRHILNEVWPALQTNGILIYSTCTYNRFENEENVQWIINELGAEILPLNVDNQWGVTVSDYGYRFYPHKTRGEGFFMAVMRKTANSDTFKLKKEKNSSKISPEATLQKNGLLNPEKWTMKQTGSIFSALPLEKADEMIFLTNRLKTIHAGIPLCEQKGKDFIPLQGLALSRHVDVRKFNHVEINWQTAIHYLQRDAIELPDAGKGYILLMYEQIPLGWVKNVGNRSNNLYPQEWRIRKRLID